MKYGADLTSTLATPPTTDVRWKTTTKRDGIDIVHIVDARTWIAAREKACLLHKCSPSEVTVEMVP